MATVVYAQTWRVLTLKNCIEALSYARTRVQPMLLHRMALVSFRLLCKNLGNLHEFFRQIVYRPPWPKIARTPMRFSVFNPIHLSYFQYM